MEVLAFIGFWMGIYGLVWIWTSISNYIEKKKSAIRDKVYYELVNDKKITKEIESYKTKLLLTEEEVKIDPNDVERTYYGPRVPKYYKFSLDCTECEGGRLTVRKGPYGTFFGCSNYPNCKNKLNNKLAREEIKREAISGFMEDIQKAYSI